MDEQKELQLIAAAELRIASAASEASFAAVVNQLLCPLLRKLASKSEAVKKRIVQVLTHVSTRLKSIQTAKLPLKDLVELYKETVAAPNSAATYSLLLSISLMYIEMAFARLDTDVQPDQLDPITFTFDLVPGISTRPEAHQQIIFAIIVPFIAAYKEKKSFGKKTTDTVILIDPYGFSSSKAAESNFKWILDKFSDLMLYSCPGSAVGDGESVTTPPGLSPNAVKFITREGKAKWTKNPTELKSIKTGILRFLQLEEMTPQSLHTPTRYCMYLSASCDPAHEVASAADDALKRMAKPSFDDSLVVSLLYRLYQGSTIAGQNPNDIRKPGNNTVKVKVLGILSRSVVAANIFPGLLQVSFDALYGESTNGRLRSAGMGFVQWIARMAENDKIRPVAPILLSGMLKMIEETGDGGSQAGEKEAESLRGFAYDIVGLLSKRAPELFKNDLTILKDFFKAVSRETRNVRVSVQDALSTMINAYKDAANDEEKRVIIEEILLENIEKSEHQARYAAVKYANSLFPFSSPLARYLNLVASADQKLEVKEEARRGLQFPTPAGNNSAKSISEFQAQIPSLKDMAIFLQKMERKPRINARAPGVKYIGSITAESYSHSLEFLRKIMIALADPGKKIDGLFGIMGAADDDSVGRIADLDTRAKVREYLRIAWGAMDIGESSDDIGGIQKFLELVERALKSDEVDAILQSTASACLVELVSLCPSSLAESYREKAAWIREFTTSVKTETRLCMARVLGIVSTSELSGGDRVKAFQKLVNELATVARDSSKQTTFEARHGAIQALGFLLGRLRYRYSADWKQYLEYETANKITAIIAEDLDATSSLHVQGACLALGEIARYGELPVAVGHESTMEVDGAKKLQPASVEKWTRAAILKKLKALGKTTKDTKIEEAALATLGQIALGTPEVSEDILDFFFTLPPILSKHVEVNFTVGDAICAAAGGFAAKNMEEYLDIADVNFPPLGSNISTPDAKVMQRILEKCFVEIRPASAPVSKKAVCVWLLSLVKFCGSIDQIKLNLPKMHTAFSNLISDRDEFTQEVASKGIGLVYELGDASIKASLVESLVSTFTEGRKLAPQSVTGETTLFQEGSLGQTPDGSNLTTYQSILSLASDLNQPDLVYKFMSLASHNAIWNSRRGASMGFGSIASLAERELAPHLSQIIPKLYRFQFDPNIKVAESMKSIWKSLVKDPKKAVDENFDVIIKDLLKSLGDRMWRTREASCLALSDIMHGRQLTQIKPYLQETWAMCFRALDDIKESVRISAFTTCKTLTNVTVKYCDPTVVSLSEGQEIMDITKGLGSKAEDVAKFSLSTILKITKKGGVLLKPHMAELISTLLESLSSLEPQVMSYLTFHTASYNITQEQLDSSRLSAAKSSPMMEAIDTCVENLDSAVMKSLMPKLFNIIRKGVGLPTKAGSARFVVTLVMRVPSDLRPFADNTLKALSGAVTDRSPAVRKSFATAIGHIAKLCSVPSLQRLIRHLQTMYTTSEEEDSRSVPGIAILEISRFSSDAFVKLNSEILPLAYIGRHDANLVIKTAWSEVWEENTAAASSAVKLHLSELLSLCTTLLGTTPSWTVKKQIGLSLRDIAAAIGTSIAVKMSEILPLLIDALSGRTWDGKESVLEALVTVSIEGKDYFKTHSGQLEQVSKIVIREAKKNNKPYKRVALEYLSKFIEQLKVDKFDDLEDYLVEMATSDDKDDDEDADDIRTKPMNLAIKANAFKALGACFPFVKESQVKWANQVLPVLIEGLETGNIWNTRISILESIEKIFEKFDVSIETILNETTLLLVIHGINNTQTDGKYTAVREQSLKTLKQVVTRIADTKAMTEKVKNTLISTIDEAVGKEMIAAILEPLKDLRKVITGMSLD
ncbi:hypothetical protein HK100_000877 [Physocladia obscura]|uniref:ARM repeat-containing protein n=1 Tax=Physocladia obscura TaxID=109957 RepID=A0AAD5XHG6_9FUNG|nr:hypothetical protein HK100_000877 [Physocladia obscura]